MRFPCAVSYTHLDVYKRQVEKPKSNKNKIIAAVVAAVAVIGIVVAFATGLFGGEQVTVPDVLGKDQQTAVELIKEAGLEVGTIDQSYNDDVDEGKVAEQTPNGLSLIHISS